LGRRDLLATLLSVAGLPLVSGCGRGPRTPTPAKPGDAQALALLDQIADDLLRLSPETATSLGIDTGSRAALRSQLTDRSADGVQRSGARPHRACARHRSRHC
jgi:hypothetical protein